MTLLILTIVFTLATSFLCSLLEATILSISHTYVEMRVKENKSYALLLKKLKTDIDRPLAAILTVNTMTHTLGAFSIGAQVLKIWGEPWAAVGSIVFTLFVLVFGELIPKTLGATKWKIIAPSAAYILRLMIIISYPVVYFAEIMSDLIGGGGMKHTVTKQELYTAAEMGADQGALNKKETTIIKNLLMLEKMYVYDIMTPKSVMLSLSWDLTVGQVMQTHQPIRYSRIPVYSKDTDHIEGFVHRYKIMEAYSQDKDNLLLKDMVLPIHTVPENITVSAVLDQLIHRNEHIFVVTDDYGSTVGLVTLEDAIETLLGVEIVDEFDSVVDLRQHALEQWRKRKRERTFA
ncbi:MAG: HlyC/CorC family transporter [Bdellovibrionaceae bacterium]|nr:HlyC/CorC family transporter [Pseudobdellovibrionaceae bacterium]